MSNAANLGLLALRVVIGERGLKQGQIEIKWRWDSEPEMLPIEGAVEKLTQLITEERETNARFRGRQEG